MRFLLQPVDGPDFKRGIGFLEHLEQVGHRVRADLPDRLLRRFPVLPILRVGQLFKPSAERDVLVGRFPGAQQVNSRRDHNHDQEKHEKSAARTHSKPSFATPS